MSVTVCFVKTSLPYTPGDVVTFDDDAKGAQVLAHPSGIARPATQRDVNEIYAKLGKTPPNVPTAATTQPVSGSDVPEEESDQTSNRRRR